MNRIRMAVSAAVLSLLASTGTEAQTKYYMRSGPIAPKTEAAASTPPRTASSCSIAPDRIINNLNAGYRILGDVTVAFTGGNADAKIAIQAHCESFKETTICEGFQPSPGKLRMRAFSGTSQFAGNNGRVYPYAGTCTPG
jgi:hypothetical protein